MLDNTQDQPSKFITKNWVKINDETWRTCNEITFNNSLLRSSLCDYSDAYILVNPNLDGLFRGSFWGGGGGG